MVRGSARWRDGVRALKAAPGGFVPWGAASRNTSPADELGYQLRGWPDGGASRSDADPPAWRLGVTVNVEFPYPPEDPGAMKRVSPMAGREGGAAARRLARLVSAGPASDRLAWRGPPSGADGNGGAERSATSTRRRHDAILSKAPTPVRFRKCSSRSVAHTRDRDRGGRLAWRLVIAGNRVEASAQWLRETRAHAPHLGGP